MTQEDKALLLKDLCARAPYGVKVCANHHVTGITAITLDRDYVETRINDLHTYKGSSIENICPYLCPMSSMTEEEKKEYKLLANHCIVTSIGFVHIEAQTLIDWLNAHHFDYRGLIKKGLALEAPEDMYKTDGKEKPEENK